jgi:hypothetical protein
LTTLDTEHAAVDLAKQLEDQKPIEQVVDPAGNRDADIVSNVIASQPKTAEAFAHAKRLMSLWAEVAPTDTRQQPEDQVEFDADPVETGFLNDFAPDSMMSGDQDAGSGGGGGSDGSPAVTSPTGSGSGSE